MKKILISLGVIAIVGAAVAGATGAFYNDTQTSTGNIFVAGSVNLKVDHTYASYDGTECVGNCTETGSNLITNGDFETPVVTDHSGQWQVYPNGSLTSWQVDSGDGLELQRNGVAGTPHGGVQLAELDSNNKSSIHQVITTVPGQKYRLTFWHSPRPNNNAGDNAIDFKVLVTSTSGVMINAVVELNSAGGSNTSWTQYTYNFIALDTQTTVAFADAGIENDSYGGYLDDVSVKVLDCSQNNYPYGGICSVWGEQDLGQSGHTFWNFPDIKPGDWGTDTISLHVYGNDSFACLLPSNIDDRENGIISPETAAGDLPNLGNPSQYGELSNEIKFFMWKDLNGNNAYDLNEPVLVKAGTPFNQIQTQMVAMSLTGNAPITLVGMSWCAGAQTGPQSTGDATPLSCDGNGMGNIAQTDSTMANFVAYAVQQRNNEHFTCASAGIPVFVPFPNQ